MRIRVNGIPAPQGSKRHVGNGRMVESSSAVGPWREAVRAETQAARPADPWYMPRRGPVQVSIMFWLPRPASVTALKRPQPVTRPDLDKLVRAVLDGIVAGGAIADDSQVCQLSAGKAYADGRAPGCLIRIEEI
jgi:crossover junction endodeoxyribonuclease RusA